MRRRLLWCLALAACAGHSTELSPASVRAQIDAATAHYARVLLSGSADYVAAAYTADGELLVPDREPVRGRDAIRAFLARFAGEITVTSSELHTDSLTTAGGSAESAGTYRQVAGPANADTTQLGEYVGRFHARWRRESDGRWLLVFFATTPTSP